MGSAIRISQSYVASVAAEPGPLLPREAGSAVERCRSGSDCMGWGVEGMVWDWDWVGRVWIRGGGVASPTEEDRGGDICIWG